MSSQNECTANAPDFAAPPSAWAPFASRAFLWLWLANAVSALGTWIQNAASAWIMTDLAPSPMMVSLVQTAAQLPVLLLALPAGAIADVMDRKRLLIITNILMLAASAILAIVAAVGRVDPAMLLGLTVLLAIGAALNSPAWAASVPLTVPRRSLPQALVLNSVGFNIARAIGPALGGLLLAIWGAAAAFSANAASFAFIALVVGGFLTFPRTQAANNVPPEPLGSAMRVGLAYALAEPVVRSTLVRSAAFFGCASAIWALLPLYVREVLGLSSASYGLMMGVIGTGAVLGGLMMPALNRLFPRNNLILLAGTLCGLALVPLAVVPSATAAYTALFVFGTGWIIGASNLQATVQLAAAPWVRARALALYQAVFNGGMGLGAIFWGWLGDRVGLTETILTAGLAGCAIALLTRAIHLPPEINDPSASAITDPPALSIAEEIRPLLLSSRHRLRAAVSYRIDPSDVPAFRSAMAGVRLSRYRDGAVGWALSRDVSDPMHWVETFIIRDWHELQRGIDRLNLADSEAVARARSYHRGDELPRVTLLLQE
ncbi:MFS transporter [Bradyrhizobium sp. KB893862 SZCCT0404]|uniref:MFS transporter n=1 Tax=Bradyrhizobium sp. KB893862 SZCCT0404 TaxID=2807672 RepID=UPI001BA553E4|nr:MFS transporter [Bradyrhizobium sp. KB893862 SZCCT0404]MBR1174872.1 MFS transporter [Bradyrhizobium sp. KB893862 SZCCT0404]